MAPRQFHVLLVDDSPEDRAAYERLITRVSPDETYTFTVAETVADALALCQRTRFDCVLLDYLLPDGDGLNLLAALKKPDEPLLVAVIVLTGQGDETVAVRAMKSGAQDYLAKGRLTSESLHRAMHHAMETVALLRKIEDQRAELTRLATLDELTGLYNRRFFLRRLHDEIERAVRYGLPLTLLLLDVDHFKRVNDTYGHQAGDAVLKALADCLVRNFPRKSDMVARYGGEEFAVVLPDTSPQNAVRLAERTRLAVSQLPIVHGSQTIGITISVGASQLGRQESVQSWIERTDQALYQAKTQGRDRVIAANEGD